MWACVSTGSHPSRASESQGSPSWIPGNHPPNDSDPDGLEWACAARSERLQCACQAEGPAFSASAEGVAHTYSLRFLNSTYLLTMTMWFLPQPHGTKTVLAKAFQLLSPIPISASFWLLVTFCFLKSRHPLPPGASSSSLTR